MILTGTRHGAEGEGHAGVFLLDERPLILAELLGGMVEFVVAEVVVGESEHVQFFLLLEIVAADDAGDGLDFGGAFVTDCIVKGKAGGYLGGSGAEGKNNCYGCGVFDCGAGALTLVREEGVGCVTD